MNKGVLFEKHSTSKNLSGFNIFFRDDLSFGDLCDLQNRGYSVVKTPHVGNFYPNNLAIGKLGFRMIMYDRNIGCVDKNFHPHTVIKNGRKHPVTSPEILMTHAYAYQGIDKSTLKDGDRVADGHLFALRKLFPKGKFIFYTDYLRQNRETIFEILKIVSEQNVLPDKFGWRRKVNREGFVTTFGSSVSWKEISRVGIFGLDNEQEGYLVPNILNVLICGIVEVINFGKEEIYHLSGPDMFRYIGSMFETLNRCLKLLSSLDSRYPKRISFNLIAVANMRFAVRSSRQKALDNLVLNYLKIPDFKTKKGEFMKSLEPSVRKSHGHLFKSTERKLRNDLIEAMENCPEVFYDIYKGDFTSQHDILTEGLYVPKWSLETSIKDINKAYSFMEYLRK